MDEKERGFIWKLIKSLDLGDVIVAGMVIPLIKDVGGKLVENVGKHAKDKFGLNTGESKKVVEDNILYGNVRFDLSVDETKQLFLFEKELRASADGENKFAALVLYVVKGIALLKKESVKGGGKNKDGSEKEPIKTVDESPGINWAKKFLKQLLAKPSFEDKVAFLEGENVFTLIKKEKETIDLIKKATELKDGAIDFGKGFLEKAKAKFFEVDEKIGESTLSFEERARARYEASKERRREKK